MNDPKPLRSLGAVMSSESEFEDELDKAPLRVTGFISVLLALLGGFSIVAMPMIAFIVAALLFGLFALRKSESDVKPVGTGAAKFGILLALFWGSAGLGTVVFKQYTLGGQAEYFAREFIKVAQSGNEAYTGELHKKYRSRFALSMPLKQTYEKERAKREAQMRGNEDAPVYNPPENETLEILETFDPDTKWVRHQPVRLYDRYGQHKAEVFLTGMRRGEPVKLVLVMEYEYNKDRGSIEWRVETLMHHRKQIVAETVL